MQRFWKELAGALVLALTCAAFAGAAFAGNGGGNGRDGDHGKEQAPGQERKAEEQAPSTTATTTAATTERSGAKAESKGESKADSKEKSEANGGGKQEPGSTTKGVAGDGSKQYGNGESALHVAKEHAPQVGLADLSGPGNSKLHKVTICHATGSTSNPYVVITVDVHALKAHTQHQDGRDVIPAPSGGCPAASSGGGTTTTGTTGTTTTGTTTTGTTTTGTTTTGTTTTVTTTTGTTGTTTTGTTGTTTTGTTTTGTTTTTGSTTTGGVAGVSTPPSGGHSAGSPQPSVQGGPQGGPAGVLGVTTRLGTAARSGTLPFTGVPLWLAALAAAGLLAAGVGLRRTAQQR
jgi:hypothetical protein